MSVAKSLSIDPELESGKRMLVALSCSLLLHLCFVFLLSSWHFNSKEDSNLTETPKPVPIRIVTMVREVPAPKKQTIDTPQPKPQPTPAISVPKEQIVSPSNSLEEAPLTETRFRSDHDSRAKVQTIKRGEDAGNHEPKTRSDIRSVAEQQTQIEPPSRKQHESLSSQETERARQGKTGDTGLPLQPMLRLNDEQVEYALLEKAAKTNQGVNNKPQKAAAFKNADEDIPDNVRELKFEKAEPFQSLGARSVGKLGNSDFLPDIQDGDVTLLNAKADRYAVFVRRVAIQVFGALRKSSWQELSQREIRTIKDFASIEAVMSKNGKLLKVEIKDSSGSSSFDITVRSAAQQGTWDQHPPVDAVASDGNIHFIFKARTWSRVIRDGFSEQRWLLLGTGLL